MGYFCKYFTVNVFKNLPYNITVAHSNGRAPKNTKDNFQEIVKMNTQLPTNLVTARKKAMKLSETHDLIIAES
jgi:hypothetical protein